MCQLCMSKKRFCVSFMRGFIASPLKMIVFSIDDCVLDFLDFLDTRGVKCEGNDLIELEKELHLQGLMKDYTDMGGAREIEPTLPRNE